MQHVSQHKRSKHREGFVFLLQLETKKDAFSSLFLRIVHVFIFQVRPVLFDIRGNESIIHVFHGTYTFWLEQLTSLAASHCHSTAGSGGRHAFCVA